MVQLVPLALVLTSACACVDPLDDDYGLRASGGSAGASTGGSGGSGAASGGGGTSGTGGVGGAGGANPNVVTFGERDTSRNRGVTSDTVLHRGERALNYGAAASGYTDATVTTRRVLLIRFDLESLPTSAVVESAMLRVFTGDDPQYSDSEGPVRFYPVLESWEEGTGDGEAGAANWDDREPGVPWSDEGAGAPDSRAADDVAVFQGTEVDTEFSFALQAAEVQSWIDDPGSNFGLTAQTNNVDGTELVLSDHPDQSKRPELVITLAE
jgi:hypothetical protein